MTAMRHMTVLVLLAACAAAPSYYWQRAGATQEDLYRDTGQCETQMYSLHPLASDEQKFSAYGACMQGRGWRLRER
jgi:hypothetical protein